MKILLITLFLMCLMCPNPLEAVDDKYLKLKVPRISAERALFMSKSGKVIIVDAMKRKTYEKYHILGAINLPGRKKFHDSIANVKLSISKNKVILVYCD